MIPGVRREGWIWKETVEIQETGQRERRKRSLERNYDRTDYRTRRFTKESLRRIGGLISNNRIVETYIQPDSNGNAYVDAGFKHGSMKFDLNLIFNPPPNFVEVPRPVLAAYAPIFLVRTND